MNFFNKYFNKETKGNKINILKKLNLQTKNEKIKFLKLEIKNIQKENTGQGAAEYILLFGGVIVIAIAALMIYRSYFSTAQTDLNASNDVNSVRDLMNST
ncbi:hypothetical protein SDC9_21437 [bioreactor metagenome]|uniref:Class III signal peptide-containing protein n=1 Tax=bioreactor metagenome TaxID=1076179 RepID=A0A644U9J6_9ZZZZ